MIVIVDGCSCFFCGRAEIADTHGLLNISLTGSVVWLRRERSEIPSKASRQPRYFSHSLKQATMSFAILEPFLNTNF
jgi:ribosomal protein L24E